LVIARHATAIDVKVAEAAHRVGVTLVRGLAVPLRGFAVVLHHPVTVFQRSAPRGHRVGIAGGGGSAKSVSGSGGWCALGPGGEGQDDEWEQYTRPAGSASQHV